MRLPSPRDARHKNQMYRLLRGLSGDGFLMNQLVFKGGTCAAMRGLLDRFSVDLDFDLPDKKVKPEVDKRCLVVFDRLGFEIKDRSREHLQYFLKYSSGENERNTLKIEITDLVSSKNKYEKVLLPELQLYVRSQTPETMLANKLFAAKARYDKTGKVAGRDFYDLHHFFLQGLGVETEVIEESSGMSYEEFVRGLIDFIEDKLSEEQLRRDLNPLLPKEELKKLNHLLPELLVFLRGELQ